MRFHMPDRARVFNPFSRSALSAKADCNKFFVAVEGEACTIVGATFAGGPLKAVKDMAVDSLGRAMYIPMSKTDILREFEEGI